MEMIGRSMVRNIYRKFKSTNIMMIHHVTNGSNTISPCILSEENFTAFISDKSFVDILSAVENPQNNNGCYALTFDDNPIDLYTFSYRICKEQSIPLTAFISTDLLDCDGYITTEQLIEMAHDPLVTIGSHGASHVKLTDCDDKCARYEIVSSKEKLERILNQEISLFAYPNGVHSGREIDLVRTAGYEYAFGVIPRKHTIVTKYNSRYCLPRFNLTDDTYGVLK